MQPLCKIPSFRRTRYESLAGKKPRCCWRSGSWATKLLSNSNERRRRKKVQPQKSQTLIWKWGLLLSASKTCFKHAGSCYTGMPLNAVFINSDVYRQHGALRGSNRYTCASRHYLCVRPWVWHKFAQDKLQQPADKLLKMSLSALDACIQRKVESFERKLCRPCFCVKRVHTSQSPFPQLSQTRRWEHRKLHATLWLGAWCSSGCAPCVAASRAANIPPQYITRRHTFCYFSCLPAVNQARN